jgi:hypothetical protein
VPGAVIASRSARGLKFRSISGTWLRPNRIRPIRLKKRVNRDRVGDMCPALSVNAAVAVVVAGHALPLNLKAWNHQVLSRLTMI